MWMVLFGPFNRQGWDEFLQQLLLVLHFLREVFQDDVVGWMVACGRRRLAFFPEDSTCVVVSPAEWIEDRIGRRNVLGEPEARGMMAGAVGVQRLECAR